MILPNKIKTGKSINKRRPFSDIFCISILTLDAILKRASFKDTKLYLNHNKNEEFDFELLSSAIIFNLFSEYGIGKKIEVLIEDLLKYGMLKYDKYKDDVFNKEIISLVPETLPLIREANSKKETDWCYGYGIRHINTLTGELEDERDDRLKSLLKKKYRKSDICKCDYCIEFRKFHCNRDKHIDQIIIEVILNINNKILNDDSTSN